MFRKDPAFAGNKLTYAIYVGMYIFVFFLPGRLMSDRTAYLWAELIAYALLGIGGIFLCLDVFKEGFGQWKSHPAKNALWLVGAFLVDRLLETLASLPLFLLAPDYESQNGITLSVIMEKVPFPIFLLALGILGPITEEVIYRSLLVRKAGSRMPVALCIIASSLLFMLGHMRSLSAEELLANLPLFTTGLVYAIVLIKSKNITVPIFLHIFHNASALLLMYFMAYT